MQQRPLSDFALNCLFILYNLIWFLALPFIALLPRVRPVFFKRFFPEIPKQGVDLWIQAASAGEANLAKELLESWDYKVPLRVLATSNTIQGKETLEQCKVKDSVSLYISYAPFDLSFLVKRLISRAAPRLVILLEAELWPGILKACRESQTLSIVLNARMNAKSFARYLIFERFWQAISPDKSYAVSRYDACRMNTVFGIHSEVLPNIKFDRCRVKKPLAYVQNPLSEIFKPQSQIAVFGSVRKVEEAEILKTLKELHRLRPRAIFAVFPRHLQRLAWWESSLSQAGIPYNVRSRLEDKVPQGRVVLWDRFGELEQAYALARVAFVGGSLSPLGGQNFLEPMSQGVVPCIGPFWDNFSWVGREVLDYGLAQEVRDSEELAQCMLAGLKSPQNKDKVHARFKEYIQERTGGTKSGVLIIFRYIFKQSKESLKDWENLNQEISKA